VYVCAKAGCGWPRGRKQSCAARNRAHAESKRNAFQAAAAAVAVAADANSAIMYFYGIFKVGRGNRDRARVCFARSRDFSSTSEPEFVRALALEAGSKQAENRIDE